MEDTLLDNRINRGADNVFSNIGNGDGNNNNIERLDYILTANKVLRPQNAAQREGAGFIVMERGGNDTFGIAAITGLDSSGRPSAYSTLLRVAENGWNTNSTSAAAWTGDTIVTRRPEGSAGELMPSAKTTSQSARGMFASLSDFGIADNQIVYGYSLFAGDTPVTNSANLVNWLNATYFPANTNGASNSAGGLDLIAGGLSFVGSNLDTTGLYYNSVPEAGTVMLGLIAGVPLMLHRRRARHRVPSVS